MDRIRPDRGRQDLYGSHRRGGVAWGKRRVVVDQMERPEHNTAHYERPGNLRASPPPSSPPAHTTGIRGETAPRAHTRMNARGCTHAQTRANKTTYAPVSTTWSSRWDAPPCPGEQEEGLERRRGERRGFFCCWTLLRFRITTIHYVAHHNGANSTCK